MGRKFVGQSVPGNERDSPPGEGANTNGRGWPTEWCVKFDVLSVAEKLIESRPSKHSDIGAEVSRPVV